MLLLLPIAFVLIWMIIVEHRVAIGFGNLSIRGALVLAFLAFELLLLAITEAVSVGHHFTTAIVAIAWCVVVVVLLVAAKHPLMRLATRLRCDRSLWKRMRHSVGRVCIEDRLWLGALALIFAILAVIGSMYLPNNPDSLVYHLARVEHWMQDRTIAPFATHYLAQIEFPPLDEYNLVLLHLFSGADRLDAGVELFAAVISVVGVSELARLLGATRSIQILAAVVCATIPSGILLATSTENDYFSAALGIGLLIIVVSLSVDRRWQGQAVALGASMGLVSMTKTTIPIMLGPAVLIMVAVALLRLSRADGRLKAVRRGAAFCATAGICGLVVVAPFVIETLEVFGSPTGPASESAVSSPLTFDAGAANVVRSVANNFHVGNGGTTLETYLSEAVLDTLGRGFSLFHISQEDVRYSQTPANNIRPPPNQAFSLQDYSWDERDEDLGANPWDVILIVLSVPVLVVAVRRRANNLPRPLVLLAVGLATGYILFSFVSKWGIYNSRYGLPLLAAWCPLIAIALSRFPRWVGRIVVIGLLVACLPQLLNNVTRPLVRPASYDASYLEPYFVAPIGQMPSAYETVTASLAQSTCERAAIENLVVYEYPLWVGLQHNHWPGLLNDFNVHNQSRKLESTYRPCAWISEESSQFITPNNNTINVQVADLALSVDANRATTIRAKIPRFSSNVRRIRVYPGGNWSLAARRQDLQLRDDGSLYISSASSRRVRLQLHLHPRIAQPSLSVFGPGGEAVPSRTESGTIQLILDLHTGMNRVNLLVKPKGRTTQRLILKSVTIAPVRGG
jgi:hypothetical protein